tara:strand:+ start:1531 stop:2562 length:1032 start_codon:yes stop_codon:yes gene_type:complete
MKDPYSGLGQFSTKFGQELLKQNPDRFDLNFLVPDMTSGSQFQSKVELKTPSFGLRYFPQINKPYSIWHSLQQFPSFFPNKKSKWILTIHDLNFLIEKNPTKAQKYLSRLQKNVDKADVITTISNFTKSEIEKHLDIKEKQVQVIYNGVPSGDGVEKKKPLFAPNRKFFFSIGIFNRKKNFEVLLPMLSFFKDHILIIAGNKDTDYGREMERLVASLNLEEQVILAGKISDSEKQWLYANCEAFLFPSLAEGFGLPVVEALYEGKPVFLSKHTSLPEIGGDKAFYFDNFNPKAMAETVNAGLTMANKKGEGFGIEMKEYASKFNWGQCISQYIKLYNTLIEST